MACEQYFTKCNCCGKQILMTRNQQNRTWIPCDPQLFRFTPGGGPMTYVTGEGDVIRGERDRFGKYFGYRAHRRTCEKWHRRQPDDEI